VLLVIALGFGGCVMLGGGCLALIGESERAARRAGDQAKTADGKEAEKSAAGTVPAKQAEIREWVDASGKHKVKASFVGAEAGRVWLKKENGKETNLAIDQLSPADREEVWRLCPAERPSGPQPGVTARNFARVRMGMTLEEVEAVLGPGGQEMSRASVGGQTSVIMAWKGRGVSNCTVSFSNGRVVAKAQLGL
jgi:hypothetical protein